MIVIVITNDIHSTLAFCWWLGSKTRREKQKFPNNWMSPKQWFTRSIFQCFTL
jgi:hypothetical protein